MFPRFVPDNPNQTTPGLKAIFEVHCPTAADYAKVLFWSFVAGFSEKFATSIGKNDASGQSIGRAARAGLWTERGWGEDQPQHVP